MERKCARFLLLCLFAAAVLTLVSWTSSSFRIAFQVPTSTVVLARTTIDKLDDKEKNNESRNVRSDRLPKLAWLMTYPNSGTTYTLSLMEQVTKTSMASNYMQDRKVLPRPTVQIFEDQPVGPFWRGPIMNPLPNTTVLVKTHCVHVGGPAKALSMSLESFVQGCRKTTIGLYDGVSKTVHLVRSPFDNLISSFHHFLKGPDNAQHFQDMCLEQNLEQWPEKFVHISFTKEDLELIWRTPCHNKVIFYVMWHNRAFELPARLGIPSLLIYYEDYEEDLQGTVQKLLDFLELPLRGELLPFTARHDYDDYFSDVDRENIKTLAKKLASKETWQAIKHYFE